ncbi:MAG: zinc-binding dehydrogenase [Desulfosarcina sp.]|jgi:propanol-preferring alcohol dehydrogenase
MKALRLVQPGQPLVMQEIPAPHIGPQDILVRVKAAGICRSDMHYRAGVSPVHPLPLTLGHEVAGVVEAIGTAVTRPTPGDRVCLHYLATCGECAYCFRGSEQFCTSGSMIGKYRDGGYAEYIGVPARMAFALPKAIPFEQGAVMMCSSATSLHAIFKANIKPGDTVAVFGIGGLGMSAIQLASVFGALDVLAVDIDEAKLKMAAALGGTPIDNREGRAVEAIMKATDGKGVAAAIELIGLPSTIRQAVDVIAPLGTIVLVGLGDQPVAIEPYVDLIGKEATVVGCADHLAQEIPLLLDLVQRNKLDLDHVVTRSVPLEADAVNAVLDQMETFSSADIRTVILP